MTIDLKELAVEYVDRLGEKLSAEKFGVQVQTVRMWKNTGKYPLPVIQEMLNNPSPDIPAETVPDALQAPPARSDEHTAARTADTATEELGADPAVPAHIDVLQEHEDKLFELNDRLKPVEAGVAQILDLMLRGQQPITTTTVPQPDPITGELPAYVGVNILDSATANLTRPSRNAAAPLSKERLDQLDPNRNKAAKDPDDLPKGHWMKPRQLARR